MYPFSGFQSPCGQLSDRGELGDAVHEFVVHARPDALNMLRKLGFQAVQFNPGIFLSRPTPLPQFGDPRFQIVGHGSNPPCHLEDGGTSKLRVSSVAL